MNNYKTDEKTTKHRKRILGLMYMMVIVLGSTIIIIAIAHHMSYSLLSLTGIVEITYGITMLILYATALKLARKWKIRM